MLALMPTITVPFASLTFLLDEKPICAISVLERFNLQVVVLLSKNSIVGPQRIAHLSYSLETEKGLDFLMYGLVRDIDYTQGLELLLPRKLDLKDR